MRLSKDQVEAYHRDGVLPLGQVLEPALVLEAREHLEALRAQNLMDNPSNEPNRRSFRLLDTHLKDPWFMTIITHPAVLDCAEAVLGPNVQFFQDNIFYKPAKEGSSTHWHQDNIWWHSDPPQMLTIWIALDDVDSSNGAVQYVPGSQSHLIDPKLPVNDINGAKYAVLSTDQVDHSKVKSFTVPAGHAVMHHCLTIHGAPPNSSDRSRRAYTVHLAKTGVLRLDPKAHPILRGSALN